MKKEMMMNIAGGILIVIALALYYMTPKQKDAQGNVKKDDAGKELVDEGKQKTQRNYAYIAGILGIGVLGYNFYQQRQAKGAASSLIASSLESEVPFTA